MKKATFFTLIGHNGEKIAQEKTGYTFSDYGYTFNLYKLGSVWCVLEASTGLQVCQVRTLKEAPAKVSEYIDAVKNAFSRGGDFLKAAIKIIADATNKAQAVENEKPAKKPHNTIKRDTMHIVAAIKTAVPHCETGDTFDIVKDSRGRWIGTNDRTKERFCFMPAHLRNSDYITIIKQENASGYFRNLDAIKEDFTKDEAGTVDTLRKIYHKKYNWLYDNEDRKDLANFDRLLLDGEILISGIVPEIISALCKAESNIFTSDRELRALAWAFGLYNIRKEETAPTPAPVETETETTTDGHKEPAKAAGTIPTDAETPATSAGTVRTEKTKPCTPCTMTAARRKWYNICGNVYRSGTEPNHGARLVKSILSGFNIRTLTSMHRTEKRGYMSATQRHKAICTRTGTPPGRTQNRTQSRTNCEVTARGSPENIASLQALILAS